MKHYVILIIGMVLTIFQQGTAQYPLDTVWHPVTPDDIAKPDYLVPVYDSIYNVDMTRVSDAVVFGYPEGSGQLLPGYAKTQAWNADMTKIQVGFTMLLNSDDYTLIKNYSGVYPGGYFNDGRWSSIEPNKRYFCWNNVLLTLDVVSDQIDTLNVFSDYTDIRIGPFEGNVSADDRYVVITNVGGTKATLYDILNDVEVSTKDFNVIGQVFDWACITPSSDYIVVTNTTTNNTEKYDLNFNYIEDLTTGNNQHADFAIDVFGNEVLVQVNPLSMTRLSDGVATDLISNAWVCGNYNYNPNIAGHISGRNFDNPGWALCSTQIHECSNGNGYNYRTEMFSIKLDGSGTIKPFGFAYTSCLTYDSYPKASISPDGTKIIFSSDWNLLGGYNDDCNAYIANVSGMSAMMLVLDEVLDVSCYGGDNGQITVSASDGVAPYEFSIDGGSFSSSNVFANLSAGVYSIMVMDGNGDTKELIVTVNDGEEILGNIVQTVNNNCADYEDGIIEIIGSGGVSSDGNYQYTLDGGDIQPTGLFTGLSTGSYVITIYDDLDCSSEVMVNIISLNNLLLNTVFITNVSCFGLANGSVTVEGVNGIAPYSYSMYNANFQNINTFDNLAGGNHTFYVMDAEGCVSETNVNLSEPLLLELFGDSMSSGCGSGNNGYIVVSALGGVSPYSYTLDNGNVSTTGVFTGLEDGNYLIEVEDANLCTASISVMLMSGDDMVIDSLSFSSVTCIGNEDGTLFIQGMGGVMPYNYVLNDTINSISGFFENLAPDTYNIEIFDANNCSISSNFVIEDASEIEVDLLEINNIDCFGMNTGSVSFAISGGVPDYSIVFNGDTSVVNPFTVDLLSAGSYPYTIHDANGCVFLDTIILTQNSQLVLTVDSIQDADCLLGLTGSVYLSATGGITPYEYSVNGESSDSGEFNDLLASNYQATVNDALGCMVSSDFVILQIGGVQIESIITNDVTCFGLQDGSITIIPVNTNLIYTYTLEDESNNTGIFSVLGPGDYSVSIVDDQNCEITVQATINEPELLTISVTDTLVSTGNNDGSITVVAEGGVSPYLYSIDNGETYQSNAVFEGLINETYTIIVMDANECQVEITQLLSTDRNVLNEDNGIAVFPVPADDILNVKLNNVSDRIINYSIYNTSGQKVFTSHESGINNTLIVNTNDFQVGLYYILLETKENIFSNRFFILR